MTVKELVENCIESLGAVRPSVDEWETIGAPVKKVRDQLIG